VRESTENRRRRRPARCNRLIAPIKTFALHTSGATAVEYGLLVAIIASVILVFTADVQSGFEGIRKVLAASFGS
jgi:Flp pilus assembly pilin Flp